MTENKFNWTKFYWITIPPIWALVIYLRVSGKVHVSSLSLILPPLWMLLLYLKSKVSKSVPYLVERQWIIKSEENRIKSIDYDKKEVVVPLNEIHSINIATNDRGPIETDVWWQIRHASGYLLIPGGSTGENDMLRMLGTLNGFDHNAVIEAMGSTQNKIFRIYSRM
jgi:hypothetical protein